MTNETLLNVFREQCADIVLKKDLTIASNVTCANQTTSTPSSSGSGAAPSATESTSDAKGLVASALAVGLAGFVAVAGIYL